MSSPLKVGSPKKASSPVHVTYPLRAVPVHSTVDERIAKYRARKTELRHARVQKVVDRFTVYFLLAASWYFIGHLAFWAWRGFPVRG